MQTHMISCDNKNLLVLTVETFSDNDDDGDNDNDNDNGNPAIPGPYSTSVLYPDSAGEHARRNALFVDL